MLKIATPILIVGVLTLAGALLVTKSATGGETELPSPITEADHDAAIERTAEILNAMNMGGKADSRVQADVVFLSPWSAEQMVAFSQEYGLTVNQFQARFAGLDEVLSAGYVVQDGQPLEEAIERFVDMQEPYFEQKLSQLEVALAEPERTKNPTAREHQIGNMREFQRDFERRGVSFSSMKVEGTVGEFLDALEEGNGEFVIAVVNK